MIVPLTAAPREEGGQSGEFMDPVQVLNTIDIQQGMVIADFGVGSGFMAIPAAKMVGNDGLVYAVDVQKQLLGDIQSAARTQGALNIQTVWADIEIAGATKIESASVDLVFLTMTLYQIEKKAEVMKEAFRVLKPGGRLLIIDWKKVSAPMGPPLELRVDPEQIANLALQVGFQKMGDIMIDQYHFGMMMTKPGNVA